MKKRLIGTAVLSVAAMAALTFSTTTQSNAKADTSLSNGKAKNVILFVGDGMGTDHRDAIRLATVGTNSKLAMDDMPVEGRVHTSSGSSFVTDSAAAATAIASGVKSYNGAVGVNMKGKPVQTVLEKAKLSGKATGLVTTSLVTDATPAAFGAHVSNRSAQSDIAKQYLENSKVDVILGGGEDYWYPSGSPGTYPDAPSEDKEEGSKGTKGNLVNKAQKLGYTFVDNANELKYAKGQKVLGLFANEEMFQPAPDGEGDVYNPTVSLRDMTKKAIDTLSQNKKGFFLVVEEEGIDEMAHNNNASLTIKAGQQLDDSVKIAKKYAKTHPDTLVLVTADHSTGGLSLETTDKNDESGDGVSKEDGPFNIANSKEQFMVDWTTEGHTASDVPLNAMGAKSELFKGVYENTYIHDALVKAMKLK
ncbi:alkaline phosphatase [Peribacillus muralis]|uniref:alkaline phosphatase n=1 Tax=Peribacillus muralis TaxID=264697 RepID=UPI001F4D8FE6|nr:alkaline phosphatase [Peribacillus muralis]MCK1995151.1 alkaline phosphatase [Peribacillus muralis]MCK2015766.1 alkaline phosphatase [Peribacillus muralis]